jgi:hypothetical protein
MPSVYREGRGFFGWVFLIVFLAFNLLMLAWMVRYWQFVGSVDFGKPGDPVQAGATIGAALATGVILFVWVCGAVITGLLALLTRGRPVVDVGGHRDEWRERSVWRGPTFPLVASAVLIALAFTFYSADRTPPSGVAETPKIQPANAVAETPALPTPAARAEVPAAPERAKRGEPKPAGWHNWLEKDSMSDFQNSRWVNVATKTTTKDVGLIVRCNDGKTEVFVAWDRFITTGGLDNGHTGADAGRGRNGSERLMVDEHRLQKHIR